MSNWRKIIKAIIISPYGAYMTGIGSIFSCAEYDNYRMRQIHDKINMTKKYNPNYDKISIIAYNKFLCPFTRIHIYKYDNVKNEYISIANEVFLTMPPIIKLGPEILN